MDALGAVFLLLLLLVFVISNIIFSNKLKNKNSSDFKLKIIFFFSSIIATAVVFIAYFIFESFILIDVLKLEINDTYAERIGKLSIILPLICVANYFLARYYLKKTKKTDEIELIGKE